MKYSIIIVAYKAEDKILKCLQSLVANPPVPRQYSVKADAQIIIIDNSPEQLLGTEHNRFFTRLCQVYTEVIIEWHPENLGFAAACNRGVELSGGDNIVLINPDTEVFPEWSERMASYLQPGIGAVGPISNFVAGWQHASLHMRPSEEMAKNARYAIKGNSKRGIETKLLIGFFLMIPRTVWDQVGGMDPQFFLGCDDLDISLRIRDAGYRLVIASDVFVYHFGHASFEAAGKKSISLNKQSETKLLAKLHAKYGDAIPTSTELWGCEILPTYVPKRMTLSVCIITRDDEANLSELLPQLGFADQIVVVDTNPNPLDRVPVSGIPFNYSGEHKPYIEWHSFPWVDDFAAARNFALSKCTGQWCAWFDSDDRIPAESAALIRAAMDNPGPLTQAQKVHFSLMLHDHGPDGITKTDSQSRIFPNIPGMKWEGRVHESYVPTANALGLEFRRTDIVLEHTGYMDPALMLKKHARNLRLMQMEVDSPMKLYHMGQNYHGLGQFQDAEECYARVLETQWAEPLNRAFKDHVRYRMASLIYTVNEGGCDAMIPYLEDNSKPDSMVLMAEALWRRGQIEAAVQLFTEYANIETVEDYYVSQQDYLQAFAKRKLEVIAKAVLQAKEGVIIG